MWLVMGVRQTGGQLLALAMLLLAAILLSVPPDGAADKAARVSRDATWSAGVAAILAASALSGLGSMLTQRASQVLRRAPALMTFEMAVLSSALLVPRAFPVFLFEWRGWARARARPQRRPPE